MPCDELPDDLKTLWREAGTDRPVFSPDQLRAEAEKLQAKGRKSHLVVGLAFASAVPCYAFVIFFFRNTLMRVGAILSGFVFGYLVFHVLRERARTGSDPGETDGIRFYRAELERRRDWHRGIRWRLLMLPVPLILVDLGLAQILAKPWHFIVPVMWSWALFLLAILGIWGPSKHLKLAREYQHRIDALDSAVRSAGQTNPQN